MLEIVTGVTLPPIGLKFILTTPGILRALLAMPLLPTTTPATAPCVTTPLHGSMRITHTIPMTTAPVATPLLQATGLDNARNATIPMSGSV